MVRLRALIADSDVGNYEVIARLVSGIGHLPVHAKTQKEAIGLLSSERFDYFIFNLALPVTGDLKMH